MIGALAGNEPKTLAFPTGTVISHRDFEGRIHGVRTRIGEEDVVEAVGGNRGDPPRELERGWMTDLETGSVVHLHELLGHGLGNLMTAVASRTAKKPGCSVDNAPALMAPVVDSLAADQKPWIRLKIPIAGERHPVMRKSICCVLCHAKLNPNANTS